MRHCWERVVRLSLVLVVPALAGCATLTGVTTGSHAGCAVGAMAGGSAGCMAGGAIGAMVGGVTGAAVDLTRAATGIMTPSRRPEPEQAKPPVDPVVVPHPDESDVSPSISAP